MNDNWKQNPHVRRMKPEKIKFLTDLTEQIRKNTTQTNPSRFLTLTMEANKRGISFSDQETELLVKILDTRYDATRPRKAGYSACPVRKTL